MSTAELGAARRAGGVDVGLRDHMVGAYAIVGYGLVATAAAAWATSASPLMDVIVEPDGVTGTGWALLFAPLALLLFAAFAAPRSLAAMRSLYWTFAVLQGPGLALLLSAYAGADAFKAAAAAAAVFGAASLYGYTTGRDLSSIASFLFVGLLGLIAASLLNLALGSPAVDFAVSAAAVIVFTGLAAWDTQRLKDSYDGTSPEGRALARYDAALGMYISVLNLFQAILGLIGRDE